MFMMSMVQNFGLIGVRSLAALPLVDRVLRPLGFVVARPGAILQAFRLAKLQVPHFLFR